MLNNKKIDIFLRNIKTQISNLLAIKIPGEKNAFTTHEINKVCLSLSINCLEIKNINEALRFIKNKKNDVLLITGSLYLVGKIRTKLL